MLIVIAITLVVVAFVPVAYLAFIRPRTWRNRQLAVWKPVIDRLGGELIEAPANRLLVGVFSVLSPPFYPLWSALEAKSRLLVASVKVGAIEVSVIPSAVRIYDKTFEPKMGSMRSDNSYRTYVQAEVVTGGVRRPIWSGDGGGALSTEERQLVEALGNRIGYFMRGPRQVVIEIDQIVDDAQVLANAISLAARLAAT